MPEMINLETWKRDLAALHDDVIAIQARVELFMQLAGPLSEQQEEVLAMITAAIDAPLSHIEARLTLGELNA